MESINRKTEMNELRISDMESRIKIESLQTTVHNNEMEMPENFQKTTKTKVRRNLIAISNKSLSIEDVRSEITKQFNKLKPASLCQPLEKVCVPGPPGKKGNKGSRGRRGEQGTKGKKGMQGIVGLPGRHGKQGVMGNQGIKGEKGENGAAGPQGMTGLKGEPGESILSPEVTVSPATQTVTENQTATFYCSATGNPRPVVTWSKVNGSLGKDVRSTNDGKLEILRSSYNDTGKYVCEAISALGQDHKITSLAVEVPPHLTKMPDCSHTFIEGVIVELKCEAFGVPPPVIQWSRPLFAFSKGRTSVNNGSLSIQDFRPEDTGTYMCTATNKLGSTQSPTALNIQTLETVCEQKKGGHAESDGVYQASPLSGSKFAVYCDVATFHRGWVLIARFSNSDSKNWMRDDGLWWYEQQAAMGTTTDPSINSDMISPAFWLVRGVDLKITRSDDPSHTPLLQTTGNCLAGQTFRSKITSFGDFRNGKVWASDQCLGSCTVQYGGQYKSTDGFQQAECSGKIQSANNIGFWCDWGGGDGSVMMIGGGGNACKRADHGIGITEKNEASLIEGDGGTEYDFGYNAQTESTPSQSYSLNLWIR